jgi:4-hydroxybenzoate polyprenyltransferase
VTIDSTKPAASMSIPFSSAVRQVDHLVRYHQVGFVAVWPLLGYACVTEWSVSAVAFLVIISLCFNTYGVVLNDVVHLHIDSRDPLRVDQWLVRGMVTPRFGLAVALVQWPLMAAGHFAAGFPAAAPWLLGAIAGQGIYDVFGKRCAVPPLAEACEAAAAFCLVVYGAAATGLELTALVWPTAATGAAFILLVNAFHGCLRDIDVENRVRSAHDADLARLSRHRRRFGPHLEGDVGVFRLLAVIIALPLYLATRLTTADDDRSLILVAAAGLANIMLFAALHYVRKPAWDIDERPPPCLCFPTCHGWRFACCARSLVPYHDLDLRR